MNNHSPNLYAYLFKPLIPLVCLLFTLFSAHHAQSAPTVSASENMTGMPMDQPNRQNNTGNTIQQDSEPSPTSMSGMMDSMQGGSAPKDARSPDYSDGISYGHMQDMADEHNLGMLLIDQLEAFHTQNDNGQTWDIEGWYGHDENKLWIRSEGERSQHQIQEGNIETLWNHNIDTYWSSQSGIRHDLGIGPKRNWAAFGIQGLAPYWFDVEATGYIGGNGRTAARLRTHYDMLFSQQLILQPELELNAYGKNDPERNLGSGLSDIQFGLRLRYEIFRECAPYIGINWIHRLGTSADYALANGEHVTQRQILAGIRLWF